MDGWVVVYVTPGFWSSAIYKVRDIKETTSEILKSKYILNKT